MEGENDFRMSYGSIIYLSASEKWNYIVQVCDENCRRGERRGHVCKGIDRKYRRLASSSVTHSLPCFFLFFLAVNDFGVFGTFQGMDFSDDVAVYYSQRR